MANDIVSKLKVCFETKPGRIVSFVCQFILALTCLNRVVQTTGATQIIAGTCLVLLVTFFIIQIFEYMSQKTNKAVK